MDTSTRTDCGLGPVFTLLQISDPYFPIGGYTHSFGLETYVQKGLVHDAASAERYLQSFLASSFLHNDLLAVKLAWEYAAGNDLDGLVSLNRTLSAAKAAREVRTASLKLGARFIKILEMVLEKNPLFKAGVQAFRNNGPGANYSVVFGLCARLLDIEKKAALAAFSYGTASSIVNNCAKLVPLSQSDGQSILFSSRALFISLLARVEELSVEDIGIGGTGFDLRSMQHERLYARLYIS